MTEVISRFLARLSDSRIRSSTRSWCNRFSSASRISAYVKHEQQQQQQQQPFSSLNFHTRTLGSNTNIIILSEMNVIRVLQS